MPKHTHAAVLLDYTQEQIHTAGMWHPNAARKASNQSGSKPTKTNAEKGCQKATSTDPEEEAERSDLGTAARRNFSRSSRNFALEGAVSKVSGCAMESL